MGDIQIEQLAKTSTTWGGAQLPAYLEGNPEVTILQFTIPPKAKLPMHKHPVINAGVLLKGKLTVQTKCGKEKTFSAGEPIVEVVEQWHFGRNDEDEPAVLLMVYAGTAGSEITIKE